MRRYQTMLAAAALLSGPGWAAADDAGWMGLGLNVEAGGSVWSPVVQSAKVSFVAADSPAARQKIAVGDALVEIDGQPVAGGDGKLLMKQMKKTVGETAHLKLRRADGTLYESDVIAQAPPH